jgi:hypothetical protein
MWSSFALLITAESGRFTCVALGAGAAAEDEATEVEATDTAESGRFTCLALGAGAAAEDEATEVKATDGARAGAARAGEAIAVAKALTAPAAAFYI